jgi:hypothetical protein
VSHRFAKAIRKFIVLAFIASMTLSALGEDPKLTLEAGFRQPPGSAKPRVWWHWMNGNITKEGIKLDLEWMNRIGIGGFQNFDASLGTPQLVEKRLTYMTPEWRDAFLYATTLADQLGLEEAIAGSPGWSESGGPWVKPSQGMKKVVWSETVVEGGKPFTGVLAHPPTVTGAFQNIPIFDFLAALTGKAPPAGPTFYADSAVIAFREPDSDVPVSSLQPKITSSSGNIDRTLLTDGDLVKATALPKAPAGQEAWIQYEFPTPQTMHAVTLALKDMASTMANKFGAAAPVAHVEVSDDGQTFRKLAEIPNDGADEHTIAFPAAIARFFRVAFVPSPPFAGDLTFDVENPFGDLSGIAQNPNFEISELVLHPGARVSRFEEKAGFGRILSLDAFATPPVAAADAIRRNDIVDLTAKMQPDGTLQWTPPPGRWTVLRFGYSLTGATNQPASPEGTGLEVDKLSREDVREYMNTYLDKYKQTVGALMGNRGLRFVVNDSWEAGTANWTDNMIDEFTKRRGYDPRAWMPVLAGRVIGSSEESDRFLWDFRKTLGDLLTEYHYDQLNDILHEHGMGHYGESHEEGRAFIGDGMEVKRHNDVPMSAMWTQKPGVNDELYGYNADIRESASVAHIYGQNLVAAESMTASVGAFAWSPASLKPTADKELAMGLNRFVIHTSVHQPLLDKKPGLSLGPFGQWFTRNETWAEQARPWVTYLARSSYLLQQGRFHADIVYFYGEDTNLTALFLKSGPDIPSGYNFDYINADALVHVLTFENGNLTTPSGMQYRVLALDPHSQHMSLPVLRKIRDLVRAGAVVCGPKPTDTPSLSDDNKEFQNLAKELWGSGDGNTVGKGKVFGDKKLVDTLADVGPDFSYTKSESDTNLLFVHRKQADGDLYFVDNRNDRDETLDATFRVDGKEPELWHADTGKIEPASFRIVNGHTTLPLHLDPWEAVFVVFRNPAKSSSRVVPVVTDEIVATVEGPWSLSFEPDRGAPAKITLNTLTSWSDSADEGVKYFSGAGTYTKTIEAPPAWFQRDARLSMDLGEVKNLGEVSVNGKSLDIVWKKPYRVDVTGALRTGSNTVEIKVTNAWANRIIGDRQPNATKTYTFTSPKFYKADSKLWPSGLLGPVKVVRSQTLPTKNN